MYTYMCAQTTYKTLTSGPLVLVWVLILCMCRYFGGSDFWVPDRGTSLVIQWHRLPLRGHQSHFPCICSRWHLGSTLFWCVEWCCSDMGQLSDTCWCTAYHVSADALCCIIQMTYIIAFNVCFKASAPCLTFSPKPWHDIMDHFPREVSTLFPSHVQQICLLNIYSIYKYVQAKYI